MEIIIWNTRMILFSYNIEGNSSVCLARYYALIFTSPKLYTVWSNIGRSGCTFKWHGHVSPHLTRENNITTGDYSQNVVYYRHLKKNSRPQTGILSTIKCSILFRRHNVWDADKLSNGPQQTGRNLTSLIYLSIMSYQLRDIINIH